MTGGGLEELSWSCPSAWTEHGGPPATRRCATDLFAFEGPASRPPSAGAGAVAEDAGSVRLFVSLSLCLSVSLSLPLALALALSQQGAEASRRVRRRRRRRRARLQRRRWLPAERLHAPSSSPPPRCKETHSQHCNSTLHCQAPPPQHRVKRGAGVASPSSRRTSRARRAAGRRSGRESGRETGRESGRESGRYSASEGCEAASERGRSIAERRPVGGEVARGLKSDPVVAAVRIRFRRPAVLPAGGASPSLARRGEASCGRGVEQGAIGRSRRAKMGQ
jgi:hypothetical protein